MKLIEETKIINGWSPQDCDGGKTGDYVSLKLYNHITIIITCGSSIGQTANITINKATAVAGTNATAYSYDAYWRNTNCNAYHGEDSTATDTLTKSTGASGTVATSTTAYQMWVFEIDAADLGEQSAGVPYDCVAAVVGDTNTCYMSCIYILSQPRYAQATPPAAISD